MSLRSARRASQVFFTLLFLWFCAVSTLGGRFTELSGWPVNLFLELDPLAAVATLLATHTLYRGLLWALLTVCATILLGRVFCGFVCPFGAMHQFVGWLGMRTRPTAARLAQNRFLPAQNLKYVLLAFFLAAAALGPAGGGSLLAGLLDPICLAQRSVNLTLLPLFERLGVAVRGEPRLTREALAIASVFLAAILLNLHRPRFFCRFLCPLGALLGLLGRFALVRIGRTPEACTGCTLCERACEGACEPTGRIRTAECVLCLNCLADCRHGAIALSTRASAAGEIPLPDPGRRAVIAAVVAGAATVSLGRIGGATGATWSPSLVRPPGALAEEEFLSRCIRCGQCMRVCPTNVIHPAGLEEGLEALWTPKLDFRAGTSGCQHTCIACGQLCPTAAIRPLRLEERLGTAEFASRGPLRIGCAFVDRGRCLPWAMDRPCIVCQENCPVSPKAIFTRPVYNEVRLPEPLVVGEASGQRVGLAAGRLEPGRFATGDYFILLPSGRRLRIRAHGEQAIELAAAIPEPELPPRGSPMAVAIRLQQPHVDPERCIGCGVCEHECPVQGKRAIRVTAENESRHPRHRMTL
ncbi:MAG: 4Fe-4S binding protein [Desulfobacterales bacterium]